MSFWLKIRGISPGEVGGLMFAGYVPLASQSRYPIIVYSVAGHLSHVWANSCIHVCNLVTFYLCMLTLYNFE